MKMTMHIDEQLLKEVMTANGFTSKTETVHNALLEMARSKRFKAYVGSAVANPLSAQLLEQAVDPDYDVHSLRVAETRGQYGK